MYGAAVATSIGYGSMFFLHTWTAHLIGFDPIGDVRVMRITASGAVAAPFIFGLSHVLPPIPALILVPTIGFIIYAITSIRVGVIDIAEIERLQQRAPSAADGVFDYIYVLYN